MKRKGCLYWLFISPYVFLYQMFKWLAIKPCIWGSKFCIRLIKSAFRSFTRVSVAQVVRRNNYDNMDGLEFEQEVAKILMIKGFKKVEVTKASGDFGVDVLATKGGKRYAIQCKRYSTPVGIGAVQQIHAGKTHYNCDIAAVITNNTYTESAKTLASELGVILWDKTFLI